MAVYSAKEEGHLHSCGGGLGGCSSRKGGIIAGLYEVWLRRGICSVADESEVDAPSRATCRMRLGGEVCLLYLICDTLLLIGDRRFDLE